MQIHCLMEMPTNIEVEIWCCRYFRSSFTCNKGEIYDCVVGCDNVSLLSVTTLPQMYHFCYFVQKRTRVDIGKY